MNKENKEKMMEYQIIEQQIQALTQNMENIDNHLEEINNIIKTLDEFKELKEGDKIKIPIANGIFADATLNNSKEVNINVGSGVVVKKDIESAKIIMSKQIKDLDKYKAETLKYYEEMFGKMQELQMELIAEQQKEEEKK